MISKYANPTETLVAIIHAEEFWRQIRQDIPESIHEQSARKILRWLKATIENAEDYDVNHEIGQLARTLDTDAGDWRGEWN